MNTSSNRMYGLALTGVGLIVLSLLCAAALGRARLPNSPHAMVAASALPGFDPARIAVAERDGILQVQLQPGTAGMGLVIVDGEFAGRRPVLVTDGTATVLARVQPTSPQPRSRAAILE